MKVAESRYHQFPAALTLPHLDMLHEQLEAFSTAMDEWLDANGLVYNVDYIVTAPIRPIRRVKNIIAFRSKARALQFKIALGGYVVPV